MYASFYTGFIYELCFTPIVDPTLIPNPEFECLEGSLCVVCPIGPVCLINCEYNEYWQEGTCQTCEEECAACVRANSCNPCLDSQC